MNDLKSELITASRQYDTGTEGFERLRRKRARKDLSERVGVSVTALVVAGIAVAILFKAFGGTGTVPAAAPSANGELLYAKKVGSGWSLFAADPVSGTERQVTHGYRDYDNAWSPDGSRIIYQSQDRETDETSLFIANADGSGARNLGIDGGSPSWSPDGSHIVYQGPGGAIWTSLPDGRQAEQLTTPPPGSGTNRPNDFHPVWSPDGEMLAFTRTNPEAGRDELRVLTRSGEETLVTTGDPDGYIGAVDWSPDGSTIVFAGVVTAPEGAAAATNSHVFTIPASGGEPTQLTQNMDGRGWNTYPTWSPDGTKIAYVDDSRGKIVVMNPDGSSKQDLAVQPGDDSIVYLNWGTHTAADPAEPEASPEALPASPSGTLYFERFTDQRRHIVSLDLSTGEERELTAGANDQGARVNSRGDIAYSSNGELAIVGKEPDQSGLRAGDAHGYYPMTWLPGGSELLLYHHFGDVDGELIIMDPATGDTRDAGLPVSGGSIYSVEYSPQGTAAYTAAEDETGTLLYVLHVCDTAGACPVVTDLDAMDATWNPSGNRLAFTSEFDIWTINPDGSNPTRLTDVGDGRTASDPRWSPEDPRWSPDGRWIAYSLNGNIWAMRSDGSEPRAIIRAGDVGLTDWAAGS